MAMMTDKMISILSCLSLCAQLNKSNLYVFKRETGLDLSVAFFEGKFLMLKSWISKYSLHCTMHCKKLSSVIERELCAIHKGNLL